MTSRTPARPTGTPQQGDTSRQHPVEQQQPSLKQQGGHGSHDIGGQRTRTVPPGSRDDRESHQAGWTDVDDDDAPQR